MGAATGLIAACFRLALNHADVLRGLAIEWGHGRWTAGQPLLGFAAVVGGCTACCAGAAWMVRQYAPQASGSGIPHVEAVLHRQSAPAPYALVPVKFIGGVMAIGAGLALGREGPSVQMGAGVATFMGRVFRRGFPDSRALIAAGAGAGLATAFNAPLAGAIFVLEELVQRYEPRITIAALAASFTAISVARLILGDHSDFTVLPLHYPALATQMLYLGLGLVCGLAGVVYNATLLGGLSAGEALRRVPVEVRAGLIGAGAGVLAWFYPWLVGGGDPITQSVLSGTAGPLTPVAAAFAARFILSAASYAALTPGGLFAPLLTLGAQLGLMFGLICQMLLPGQTIQPVGFALVGMAALFTGIVRSPVTGLILVTEMTGSVTLLLPMVGACFTAMLVPTLLGNAPIYDALRQRAAKAERDARRE